MYLYNLIELAVMQSISNQSPLKVVAYIDRQQGS